MTRKQWLNELVTVDEWGRPPGLADVPLTLMKRSKVFELRDYDEKTIEGMWNIYLKHRKQPIEE